MSIIQIKAQDGDIKVCYDRRFPPEKNDPKYCKELKTGEEAVFTITNPCKGKTVYSCEPLYFTIWGKDRNTNTQCLGIKLFKHLRDFLTKYYYYQITGVCLWIRSNIR